MCLSDVPSRRTACGSTAAKRSGALSAGSAGWAGSSQFHCAGAGESPVSGCSTACCCAYRNTHRCDMQGDEQLSAERRPYWLPRPSQSREMPAPPPTLLDDARTVLRARRDALHQAELHRLDALLYPVPGDPCCPDIESVLSTSPLRNTSRRLLTGNCYCSNAWSATMSRRLSQRSNKPCRKA